ncbi:MAG: T9SS type A sorting domain-containing protein, partial [Dysgonamonadaceae bacterium]|nr:T9SS type A sorting domain-containing protein [Dysgonamonadaceae bacterium]
RQLQVTSTGDAISEVTVTALQGIRIASQTGIGQQSFTMQLPATAQGVYIVRVRLASGATTVKKVKM